LKLFENNFELLQDRNFIITYVKKKIGETEPEKIEIPAVVNSLAGGLGKGLGALTKIASAAIEELKGPGRTHVYT
jgi:hypothetical protein